MTGKEFHLQANEQLNQDFYIRDKKTGNDVILKKIKIGSQNKEAFFAQSQTDPNGNLLVEMEQEFKGEHY